MSKQRELNILPMKFKFALIDLILLFKILNYCIPLKLPEHFTFLEPGDVIFTKKTSTIYEDKDVTHIIYSIKPSSNSFKNCYFYRTMILWNSGGPNSLPYIISDKNLKFHHSNLKSLNFCGLLT